MQRAALLSLAFSFVGLRVGLAGEIEPKSRPREDPTPRVEVPKVQPTRVKVPRVQPVMVIVPRVEAVKVVAPRVDWVRVNVPKVAMPRVEKTRVEFPSESENFRHATPEQLGE